MTAKGRARAAYLVNGRKITIQPFTWEELPLHPTIALKAETSAHRITGMTQYGNLILLGYGDWTANTGPVHVVGLDVNTGEPVTLFGPCPTENFTRFREIEGWIYAPWIDPTYSNQGGYTTNEGGTWQNVNILGTTSMVHTFDIMKFNGLLYACGSWSSPGDSTTGHGVVYQRSLAGVWSQVLVTPTHAPMTRIYTMEIVGSALTAREFHDSTQTRLWSTETGTDWTAGPFENIQDTQFKADPKDPRTSKWFPAHPRLHPMTSPLFTVDLAKIPGLTTGQRIWTVDNTGQRVIVTPPISTHPFPSTFTPTF